MKFGSIYIIILIFIGLLLFVFAFGLFSIPIKRKKRDPIRIQGNVGDAGVCPVCTTVLVPGEQLKSALYPGEKERMCHIFGCPHCHPYIEEGIKRICPVCKKKIPQEGYLIARLFERPDKKRHVHILGCTVCRIPQKK